MPRPRELGAEDLPGWIPWEGVEKVISLGTLNRASWVPQCSIRSVCRCACVLAEDDERSWTSPIGRPDGYDSRFEDRRVLDTARRRLLSSRCLTTDTIMSLSRSRMNR